MKILCISDTHGKHKQLGNLQDYSDCDMIIHGGDISPMGMEFQVTNFLDWFSKLQFKYKIFIPGNHDHFFQQTPDWYIKKIIPEGVIYLNENGVKIESIKIWGSPYTPTFLNWAFMKDRGIPIAKHWNLIPEGTDILITHGPLLIF
jgi:predicted phosphodiesterase